MHNSVTLQDFSLLNLIGKGSYAKVVLTRKKSNQKLYAMKILKKKFIEQKKQQQQIITERNVLVEVDHPFIIKMHYSFQNMEKLFFVLEYCPGGELFTLLCRKQKFSQDQTRFYAAQILLAIEYLHSKNIIYRDLKPQNILIDEYGYIKLTDFGLSNMKLNQQQINRLCGTPQYLAPQILYKQNHGKAVDWWCLGSIIYEMITGFPPFHSKNRDQLFDKIKFANPNIPSFISSKLKSLLQGLLQKKAENRLGSKGAESVKKHPWFEKVRWESLLKKQIKPPFKPIIKSQMDVSNFEGQFTEHTIESQQSQNEQNQGKKYKDFSFDNSLEQEKKNLSKMQQEELSAQFEMKQEHS